MGLIIKAFEEEFRRSHWPFLGNLKLYPGEGVDLEVLDSQVRISTLAPPESGIHIDFSELTDDALEQLIVKLGEDKKFRQLVKQIIDEAEADVRKSPGDDHPPTDLSGLGE